MSAPSERRTGLPNGDRDTELLLAMLDDALGDAEFESLVVRLRNEPALRRQALGLAGDDETLRDWAAISPDVRDALVTSRSARRGLDDETDSPATRPLRSRRRGRRFWRLAALAAGAACLLAVAVFWPRPAREIATISRSADAAWVNAVPQGARPRLTQGQQLALSFGQIEITYDHGVRVWLQGPASVRLVSSRALEVAYGVLAVDVSRVDPQAGGSSEPFAIATPHARVVDQGTRFAMSVDEGGQIELVVYEGAVRTEPLVDGSADAIESPSGTAVRIDPTTGTSTRTIGLEAKFLELGRRLDEQAVPASADHFVRGGEFHDCVEADGGGPRGDTLLLKTHRGYDVVRKAWVRFDLSAVACELDDPATFVFRHCEPATDRDFRGTLAVFALRPGFRPGPQQQGLRWKEEELNWDNAPGNDRHGPLVQEEYCLSLGDVPVDCRAANQPRGTAYQIRIPRLRDVVQEDGSVTIIVCVRRQDGPEAGLSVAATDNQEIAGPELIVPLDRRPNR